MAGAGSTVGTGTGVSGGEEAGVAVASGVGVIVGVSGGTGGMVEVGAASRRVVEPFKSGGSVGVGLDGVGVD